MQDVKELLARCKNARTSMQNIMVNESQDVLSETTRTQLMTEMTCSDFKVPEVVSFIRESGWQTRVICGGITINVLHRMRDVNADVPISQVHRVARRVACMFRVLGMPGPLVYWFIPSLATKVFPDTHVCVDKMHVNSAYTYKNGTEVYIYRREEFPKVMLHEALHHSQFNTENWDQPILSRVFTKFAISPETILRPNEAIIESWAELFHLAFISQEYNFDFYKLSAMELKWTLMQARRILSRHVSGPADTGITGMSPWKEKSHAYSYYVIRSFFMFAPDTFVRIAREKKDGVEAAYVDLAVSIADSPAYHEAFLAIRVPMHTCFRMTVFGDL